MLVVGILAYVASVFTIGRWIACQSLRTAKAYRQGDEQKSLNVWAWLLFPASAGEHHSQIQLYSFAFGLNRANHDERQYLAVLAWIWPAKIAFNVVMGALELSGVIVIQAAPVVERIFYGPAVKCKTNT